MNAEIYNFLNEYVNYEDPQYAVLLTGKWGCGKTFFIKKWEKEFESNTANTLKPIYVSLFGLNSVNQIDVAIDRVINPWYYSKWAEAGKKALKLLSKIALKTDFDFDGDGKDDTSLTLDTELKDDPTLKEKESKNYNIFIFDDLERCLIDIRELLGYINILVEHHKSKVIILGDIENMQDKNFRNKDKIEIYKSFEEKTIGRTFTIESDINSTVNSFIEELSMNVLLKKEDVRNVIVYAFQCAGYKNLRVLRQALMDFNQMLSKIDQKIVGRSSDFCKVLLAQYIIAYMEIKSGDRDLFLNLGREKQMILSEVAPSEKKDKYSKLQQKYKNLSRSLNYDLLDQFLMGRINSSIMTGWDISPFIEGQLRGMLNQTLIQRVTNWFNLDNKSFDKLYEEVSNYILSEEKHSVQEYVSLLEWTSLMDQEGIKKQNPELTDKVKKILTNKLDNCKTTEDLYNLKMMVMQGTRHREGGINSIFDKVTKWFYEEWNNAHKDHKDKFFMILEHLNDETVFQLVALQTHTLPDHSTYYAYTSIYDKINIQLHAASILKLSNSGRIAYSSFLEERYHLNYGVQDLNDEFMADINPLRNLKSELEEKAGYYTSVDLFSIKHMIEIINKVIKLSEVTK